MTASPFTCLSHSAEETAEFACRIGARLESGDTILLSGPVGAGKSHFCRSLIQSRLSEPEDVPSPTFTLVQMYDTTKDQIWHADLYRLTGTDEIEELGLFDAFEQAICLVEWPDRLGDTAPPDALALTLSASPADENHRTLEFTWSAPKWAAKLDGVAHG
ncbi:MAG: tRNA (adenosine(37)-N6)-threonylcarbamoyltransferase complex ATPase subunit type 1 TsaE [Pseudooceanicola sp.]|jgi:tRNA threonylcarbamoyladenosine biosynthesis protein TsaE|nr:tRNA (adenosine(37)-N6)-threonylcarbamoyltransferase complex ATPase subunit type 1 TsaE [Pseudooceanicola sp.]|tara:strand:+ start:2652 stop:3131 length:480 start_codon:yes stop_codon:yes gene_type:complete